ncbi:GNAT family N-acetyltransferase [Deinococcus peraridilitoris]|uniref:Acetyltransferase n=1 Tax=Deinococcus peraridilitoris (strain DSM 19664 / LMG 22246 / CIP 109416 / KR-200) TaxID=937777 RepID=K9ZZN2_DEIPD|nr:GNAT family N-acetyltransferase [Deinococcus peraridilitoris]AFZ66402.1 acetyltransferase [Deinococcus peraridilitoris DSM 19664]
MSQTLHLTSRVVHEAALTTAQHEAIRRLLNAAFPEFRAAWAKSTFWGSLPEQRIWLEDSTGRVLAHLVFSRRRIGVGEREVHIAGVGGVCTDPELQGQGLGRQLMQELRRVLQGACPADFAFLGCRMEVVGFYERCGFSRVPQVVRYLDPDDVVWVHNRGPAMVLPARAALSHWPKSGLIDLRGLPW